MYRLLRLFDMQAAKAATLVVIKGLSTYAQADWFPHRLICCAASTSLSSSVWRVFWLFMNVICFWLLPYACVCVCVCVCVLGCLQTLKCQCNVHTHRLCPLWCETRTPAQPPTPSVPMTTDRTDHTQTFLAVLKRPVLFHHNTFFPSPHVQLLVKCSPPAGLAKDFSWAYSCSCLWLLLLDHSSTLIPMCALTVHSAGVATTSPVIALLFPEYQHLLIIVFHLILDGPKAAQALCVEIS